jgi:hypothetical protein
MPTVTIPASYFTQQVRKEYNRPNTALMREFLQNSVDAGSTEVKFDFREVDGKWHLICQDNGCGMAKDVLVKALLTYGSSFKGPNSIGGFGCAKIILCFSHQSYRITTCQNGVSTCVLGAQLDYEFEDCILEADGTTIDITFHDDYGIKPVEFLTEIEAFLCKCNTEAKIWLNGVEVKPQFTGWEDGNNEDWCNVKIHENVYGTCYAWVRIKGILMFELYTGSNKTQVAIEITKPSTEILTVNRDGFNWKYTDIVGKIVNKIVMEKENYGKVYNQKLRWRGKNRNFDPIEIESAFVDAMFEKAEAQALAVAIRDSEEAFKTTDPDASRSVMRDRLVDKVRTAAMNLGLHERINDVLAMVDDLICDNYADFVVHVRGKGFDKIPDYLNPTKMSKAYVKLAKMWKHCVKLVMSSNDVRVDYCVGWVLDKDETIQATHQDTDGVHTFLLNPLLTWMDSSNHMAVFNEMILIACHEVTHVNYLYHDESFTCAIHKMIHKTLCNINKGDNSWWKEYQAAKEEVL